MYSIDYLIGDASYLRRGLGRQIILALSEMIRLQADARRIVVQPDAANAASRAALLSCGFTLDEPGGVLTLDFSVPRPLSQMSKRELWQLFPIRLTPHNPARQDYYAEQARMLGGLLPPDAVKRISHIGSTAIPSIWAKPIVDILPELRIGADADAISRILTDNGWNRMNGDGKRISFNLGYTPQGFADKVYHLHVRSDGDNDELYFRDYLTAHAELAEAYERLKLTLWRRCEHDRDAYTDAKTAFVRQYTDEAKQAYPNRY